MKILKSDLCTINYSDCFEELANRTVSLLEKKVVEYNEFFGVKNNKVIVNFFDNVDDFRKFIYELRGEEKSLPDYARGTYDKGMVNACVDPNDQKGREYVASHELFHILYMNHILKDNYDNRIVWYDEGMAKFMSGEKDWLASFENFVWFYNKVKKETKVLPNLNDLVHGPLFKNENYNGYNLSYLVIRYLSEILDKKEFKNLLDDFDFIKVVGIDGVKKMFDYYDDKLSKKEDV